MKGAAKFRYDLWVDFNDVRDGRATSLREHAATSAATVVGLVVLGSGT